MVTLSGASGNATISVASASGTIQNDDAAPKGRKIEAAESEILMPVFEPLFTFVDHDHHHAATVVTQETSIQRVSDARKAIQAIDHVLARFDRADDVLSDVSAPRIGTAQLIASRASAFDGFNVVAERSVKSLATLRRLDGSATRTSDNKSETIRHIDAALSDLDGDLSQ